MKIKTIDGDTEEVLMRDLKGRTVKTKTSLKNGWGIIPAGSICYVDGTWRSGVSLTGPTCEHCGMKICISRVHHTEILLIPV